MLAIMQNGLLRVAGIRGTGEFVALLGFPGVGGSGKNLRRDWPNAVRNAENNSEDIAAKVIRKSRYRSSMFMLSQKTVCKFAEPKPRNCSSLLSSRIQVQFMKSRKFG
jgi:hypothetical protein